MCPGWLQVLINASSTKAGKLYNLYNPLKHGLDFPFIPKKCNPYLEQTLWQYSDLLAYGQRQQSFI